jgi:hypothetical protein
VSALEATPGPWFVAKGKPRRVCGKDGVSICNAILRNQGGPKAKANLKDEHEAEANALLISAAHDLLDALAAIMPSPLCGEAWGLPDTESVQIATSFGKIKAARAAIAKATGQ